MAERNLLETWVSGTEEPDAAHTGEGAQEMAMEESGYRFREQLGAVVTDDYLYEEEVSDDERMIVNMGPQHPSTHGVLRLQLELEGEMIKRCRPVIGYLHTGMEKTAETLTFMQGPTNVTRMDYLAPLHNELAFSLATEKLLESGGPPPGGGHPGVVDRVEPHLLAPRGSCHQRDGHRGDLDDDVRVPRERVDPGLLREDHRPPDEPQLHPPGGSGSRPAARLAEGREANILKTIPKPGWGNTTTC